MVLIPDIETVMQDPFWEVNTLSVICQAAEADTKAPFDKDPRGVAKRAETFLRETGIADEECLESGAGVLHLRQHQLSIGYQPGPVPYRLRGSGLEHGHGPRKESGSQDPRKGGYHAIPPLDFMFNARTEMVQVMRNSGIQVKYHHHEVGGPGQSEIEILFYPLVQAADAVMWSKYVIKMVALKRRHTVTFMPKPLYNEAGSGMHFHQKLFKNGVPILYDPSGYAGLSKTALHYIGGVLSHGQSLIAFTNPSTNSFKRLVPGFEAPVNLFFSLANRSAAIRIPKYALEPHEKDFEFRSPDATCNIYLAMSAVLMAGIDGIRREIDPMEAGFGPHDLDIEKAPPEILNNLKPIPSSLKDALDALKRDHEYLLEGGVFTKEIIDTWIDKKMKEYYEVRNRPHPYEMNLYYEV